MRIISVNYLNDYKLEIIFSNSEKRICDFEFFLKNSKNKSISKYLNIQLFKKVIVDTGFLSWNDGEMEISASSAYSEYSIQEILS